VRLQMACDDFVEQAVERATHRGDEVEGFAAAGIALERPFDRAHLPRNAPRTRDQVAVSLVEMAHRLTPYRIWYAEV